MIVCHKYKFIFLKTNKTAGTSVEVALSRFCSEDDIVTHLSEEEERERVASGGVPSSLYLAPWTAYHPGDWWRRLVKGRYKHTYYNHIPAQKLKARLDPEIWDSYLKFCVVRNPWDRVISQYFWRYRDIAEERRPSLDKFLDSTHARSLVRKGYELYTIGGKVVVDRICRYEHLEEDLEALRQELGLPEPILLPRTKSVYRSDRRHYRDVLTSAQREKIGEMFKAEIMLNGYEY
ncbi:sulfotransferase family protein [Alcanivorax sp. JB21]|uniref:sulfotransferase family 2 domain-containing protein n=1 Tax=Alcanivorax limicola TaxID=2874102 RepID=UPI001CBBD2B7|nr:sulfotransferase family 2 domain-containing protein [Alcanivorax limicola]MBZ2188703.1 sulfotransferase family protein [Alcanivorax limicola]